MSTTVAIGDLIPAVVLQGVRHDTAWRTARGFLLDLEPRVLGGAAMAQNAATHCRTLRSHGMAVRKTIDCIIAISCIVTGIPLLHNGRDFQPFAQYPGLAVVTAP